MHEQEVFADDGKEADAARLDLDPATLHSLPLFSPDFGWPAQRAGLVVVIVADDETGVE